MSEPYPTGTDVAIPINAAEEKVDPTDETTETEEYAQPSESKSFFDTNFTQQKKWPLYRFRYFMREYIAEFFGTLVLVFYGDGVVASSNFGAFGEPSYLAVTFGWGFGLCMALYISMGVSGGHLNPAVTIANAAFNNFPWIKAPGFILAQLTGGFVGAACMWGLFRPKFDAGEKNLGQGETMIQKYGGIFCTYPGKDYPNGYAAYSELINTALLVLGIMGINDERMTPAINFKPVAVGLLVFVIGMCSGVNSGYAINPARDLGPRMMSAVIYGREAFTLNSHYFWIPIFMPIAGALIGMLLYVHLIVPKELS